MKLKILVLMISPIFFSTANAAYHCEVETREIVEAIGEISASESDEVEATAAAAQTCIVRYQERKQLAFDDAFDKCVNLKCKKSSKRL